MALFLLTLHTVAYIFHFIKVHSPAIKICAVFYDETVIDYQMSIDSIRAHIFSFILVDSQIPFRIFFVKVINFTRMCGTIWRTLGNKCRKETQITFSKAISIPTLPVSYTHLDVYKRQELHIYAGLYRKTTGLKLSQNRRVRDWILWHVHTWIGIIQSNLFPYNHIRVCA